MSIPAINASWQGAAPVAGGSTILALGGSSNQELCYIGTATHAGDNSTTAAVINYFDGTNTLSFTPSAIIVGRTGGNAAATQTVASVSTINNVGFTVNYTAAPGTGLTITTVFFALK